MVLRTHRSYFPTSPLLFFIMEMDCVHCAVRRTYCSSCSLFLKILDCISMPILKHGHEIFKIGLHIFLRNLTPYFAALVLRFHYVYEGTCIRSTADSFFYSTAVLNAIYLSIYSNKLFTFLNNSRLKQLFLLFNMYILSLFVQLYNNTRSSSGKFTIHYISIMLLHCVTS